MNDHVAEADHGLPWHVRVTLAKLCRKPRSRFPDHRKLVKHGAAAELVFEKLGAVDVADKPFV